MKRFLCALLALIMILGVAACANTPAEPSADSSSVETAKAWLEEKLDKNTLFSFKYDGKDFADFIGSWTKTTENSTDEDGNSIYTVSYKSADGVVATATAKLYADFAAVDWVMNFENTGSADCKPISDILPLDAEYGIDNATVTYAYGGTSDGNDFTNMTQVLAEEPEFRLSCSGGRSSQDFMPYFDVCNGEEGVLVAIGWTGQWSATVTKGEGDVAMTAGMSKTDIALHGAEKMRTPSIVITFFTGDRDQGHNDYRQLVLKNYTPVDETGNTLTHLPMTINCWGSSGETKLLSTIKQANNVNFPFDIMWVDAGWHGEKVSVDTYDNAWYYEAGNWYINEKIYPNGLKGVTDTLHEQGKKFLLWFEPERLMKGTDIYENHPEYVMKASSAAQFYLYNLADDEATDYLIDIISGIINDNGIDWYRQDFNCNPLANWQYVDSTEGEHRSGITEIKYITNLYRYLDGLIEAHPGLLIDNCASGGRRLDIEMMKRSVPLWRSDYYVNGSTSNTDSARSVAYNLCYWVPISCGGSTTDGVDDTYEFRCQMGSGMTMGVPTTNLGWWQTMMDQYLKCRELMTGDFYALAQGDGTEKAKVNACYEYYMPETGEGFLMAFRPEKSIYAEQTFDLKGLDPEATYTLEVVDNGEVSEFTGAQLMEDGLTLNFSSAKMSLLIYITRK